MKNRFPFASNLVVKGSFIFVVFFISPFANASGVSFELAYDNEYSTSPENLRVIGGQDIKEGDYPWMVSLHGVGPGLSDFSPSFTFFAEAL